MSKIKVLLVDDNDETREGTRRLLEYEDDIEIVDFAENGLVGLEKVKALLPDVVLMDINMPVMDGLTATQRIQEEAPVVQVIIVSVQDDPNYMRKAIRAGASDFVAKPISSDELAEAIRQAYRKRPTDVAQPAAAAPSAQYAQSRVNEFAPSSMPSGHVIAVVGPKGGVGKTTVAINLGVGIVRTNASKKVVIVDGNFYFGDVGVFLNSRGQHSVVSLAEMATNPEEIDSQFAEKVYVPHESGVQLLIAPSNPGDMPAVGFNALKNMFDFLKGHFDYIIVDCTTVIDDVLAALIQSADKFVLLAQPTMPALKDARILTNEITAAGIDQEDILLVLNRIEKSDKITPDQIANFLKLQVKAQIPNDSAVDEALYRAVPVVTLDSRRVAAVKPLMDLVQLVMDSVDAYDDGYSDVEDSRRSGLFGGLRGR